MNRPSALGYLWRHHRAALIGMGLALAVAVAFAVRLTIFTLYWADPAHRDQRIEGWMTPGYIARSWEVDPALIRATLALEPGTRPTLAQIAAAEGIPLPDLIARLEAAIAAARAE